MRTEARVILGDWLMDVVFRLRGTALEGEVSSFILNDAADEIERLRNIIRSCVHGPEVVDLGGEAIGLHMPNKHCRTPLQGLDTPSQITPDSAGS